MNDIGYEIALYCYITKLFESIMMNIPIQQPEEL